MTKGKGTLVAAAATVAAVVIAFFATAAVKYQRAMSREADEQRRALDANREALERLKVVFRDAEEQGARLLKKLKEATPAPSVSPSPSGYDPRAPWLCDRGPCGDGDLFRDRGRSRCVPYDPTCRPGPMRR